MRRSTPYGGPPRRVYNKFLIVYQMYASLSRLFESFLRFCEDLQRSCVVSRPAPRSSAPHFYKKCAFSIDNHIQCGYNICISKGDKSERRRFYSNVNGSIRSRLLMVLLSTSTLARKSCNANYLRYTRTSSVLVKWRLGINKSHLSLTQVVKVDIIYV